MPRKFSSYSSHNAWYSLPVGQLCRRQGDSGRISAPGPCFAECGRSWPLDPTRQRAHDARQRRTAARHLRHVWSRHWPSTPLYDARDCRKVRWFAGAVCAVSHDRLAQVLLRLLARLDPTPADEWRWRRGLLPVERQLPTAAAPRPGALGLPAQRDRHDPEERRRACAGHHHQRRAPAPSRGAHQRVDARRQVAVPACQDRGEWRWRRPLHRGQEQLRRLATGSYKSARSNPLLSGSSRTACDFCQTLSHSNRATFPIRSLLRAFYTLLRYVHFCVTSLFFLLSFCWFRVWVYS